jgi:hypothetical protein
MQEINAIHRHDRALPPIMTTGFMTMDLLLNFKQ